MADEYYRIQASYQTKFGLMVNIRHETPEGFVELMEKVAQMGPMFDAVGETINPPKGMQPPEVEHQAEQYVAQNLGGTVVSKVCPHGEMTLKEGGNWKAWMCPAKANDPGKCQPIDFKTGRPWPKR